MMPDNSGKMAELFEATGIITWPDRDVRGATPAQDAYLSMQQAILKRTVSLASEGIGRAFQQAANEVLDRERERRRALGEANG